MRIFCEMRDFMRDTRRLRRDFVLFWGIIRHFCKAYKYKLLFIYAIYLIATSAMIIASADYFDDIERNITGAFGFGVWNRYIGNVFSAILQANPSFLLNIAPFSTFVSIFILSLCSLMLCCILKRQDSIIALFASVGIGIFPYFLSNLSYHFDSPFMSLSIFFAIFPFMFLRLSGIGFIGISIISLNAMLMSYQASSGIYIVISIFLILQSLLKWGGVARLFATTSISFVLACLIFATLVYTPVTGYANNTIVPVKYFVISVYKHIALYFMYIYHDFKPTLIFALMIGFGVIFVAKSMQDSAINKLASLILSLLAFALMAILSYGIYIIIITPLYEPRALIGVGFLTTLLVVYGIDFSTRLTKYISCTLALFYSVNLVAFANYYGNMLGFQKDYENFRITIALNDMRDFLRQEDINFKGKFNISVKSGEDMHTPVIINAKHHYPIISRILPAHQHKSAYVYSYQFISYGVSSVACEKVNALENGEILVDNYFHQIKRYHTQDGEICYVIYHKDMILPDKWGYFF